MASVPSYVLAGILRHRRKSSEAALKYAVFGAGTAGVMLYGISLLAGALGSAHLPTMAAPARPTCCKRRAGPDRSRGAGAGRVDAHGRAGVQALGRAVPFLGAGRLRGGPGRSRRLSVRGLEGRRPGPADPAGHAASPRPPIPSVTAALAPARLYIAGLIGLLAAVTCTFGNLAAYGQTNMKRLLAYSTIAHAGYMMMPVAAAVALAGQGNDPAARRRPSPRC